MFQSLSFLCVSAVQSSFVDARAILSLSSKKIIHELQTGSQDSPHYCSAGVAGVDGNEKPAGYYSVVTADFAKGVAPGSGVHVCRIFRFRLPDRNVDDGGRKKKRQQTRRRKREVNLAFRVFVQSPQLRFHPALPSVRRFPCKR